MPGYSVRVERYSISPLNVPAVTWVVRYPRRVLAEVVTHRTFSDVWGEWDVSCTERATTKDISKNSASSRAIPFERMVKSVKEDPFVPRWTANARGMQGAHVDDPAAIEAGNAAWDAAMHDMIARAEQLHALGFHKQDCNRLLEPFAWITQVLTATGPSIANFFALRTHHAADPHFRTIARMMYLAMADSTPTPLDYGQWHLPFVPFEQWVGYTWTPDLIGRGHHMGRLPDLIRHSAARCAWVSYENHDKDGTPEAMDRTFDRLLADVPVHASPVEHQLSPMHPTWAASYPNLQSNCKGWLQARKLIPMESITQFAPDTEEVARWREEVSQWYQRKA